MANENQVWYEDIMRKGTLRKSGMQEIAENNPLDWQRLRILENGKFVPAMANGHSGAPGTLDMDLLRDAAEKGNLFLYRLGEEYPYRLADGVWYSTDPAAAQEAKPEVQQDNAARIQEWEKRTRFYGSLGTDVKRAIRDEMAPRREEIRKHQEKQRAFVIDSQPLLDWYNNDFSRSVFQPGKGPEAVGTALDWSQYRIWDGKKFVNAVPEGHKGTPDIQSMEKLRDAAQNGTLFFYRNRDEYPQRFENGAWYDTSPVAMQEKKPEVQQDNAPEIQAWEKRVGYYNGLSADLKQGIQNGVAQRRAEIRTYQEKLRTAMGSQPLGSWYNNEFRKTIMQPSKDPDLLASDGMDWSRVRIWDGQNFVRAVPEGHVGMPDNEALKKLQDAVQKGNLFMYQRGDKYPSKWMGNHWSSMDKGWIDRCKPEELKPPTKPEKPAIKEPTLEDATKGVSRIRLGLNRRFGIKAFKAESEKYEKALADYRKEKDQYDRAMEQYDRAMEEYNRNLEDYNRDLEAKQNNYTSRLGVYEHMLKAYEGLSPEQRAAMEKDVQQRTEEIKKNKEIEKKIAAEKLTRETDTKIKIADAEARLAAMSNQPEQEAFLNGTNPLGQNAYNTVAAHGYVLPVDARIAPNEVASIHIVLAGSKQAAAKDGLSPLNAQEYGQMLDGVMHGDPNSVNWQYIAASYDAAQKMIAAFEKGDPKPLAEALGEGVRNLMNASKGRLDMSPEMAGKAKLAEKIFEVLDTHKELMDNCTLKPEEVNFARGMVNLGKIYNNYIDARMELTMMSTGAQKLPPDKVNEHTANLLIGKMAESRLRKEQQGLEQPTMLEVLGKGNGQAINVVQFAYRNNPDIQKFAADPQNQKEVDLDKRAKGLAHLVGTTVLANPKESQQLQEQIIGQVKARLENTSPQALEAQRLAEEKEIEERQQVREMLAEQNIAFRSVPLTSPVVTEKLNALREARKGLEKQAEIDKKAIPNYDLTAPEVQAEILVRAEIRELLFKEKLELQAQGKAGPDINDFTVSRRLAELRTAQKQLSGETPFALTSKEVIEKAAENRVKRAEQLRKPVTEMLQAQKVYLEEKGKLPEVKAGTPTYRSDEVIARMKELQKAREALGPEGKDLPLDDMRVIQQDYKRPGKNPLKDGIVDVASLTDDQRKEYTERMDAIDFLRNVRGVKDLNPNSSRYDAKVENILGNLRKARADYEKFVEGAETGLPLSDPKILAVHMYNVTSYDSAFSQKVKFDDVAALAQKIQGKNFDQAQIETKRQVREIQIRDHHPKVEGEPYERQGLNNV